MTADPKRTAQRIRAAREQLGRNKNQMARALGTSWQHVDRWETGKTLPGPEFLRKLAGYLGVSVDHLVGADARDPNTPGALEEFLESYAPRDLTGRELEWLKNAPLGPEATPGRYVDLLSTLRAGDERPAPPRSGPQPKVDRAHALAEAKKKQSG
jgi:transcriptional regulator with XRE-family HTH domain